MYQRRSRLIDGFAGLVVVFLILILSKKGNDHLNRTLKRAADNAKGTLTLYIFVINLWAISINNNYTIGVDV